MGVKEAPVEEGSRSPDRVFQIVTGPIKSSVPEILKECAFSVPEILKECTFHDYLKFNQLESNSVN